MVLNCKKCGCSIYDDPYDIRKYNEYNMCLECIDVVESREMVSAFHKIQAEIKIFEGIPILSRADFPTFRKVDFFEYDFEMCGESLSGKGGLYKLIGEHGYTLYIGKTNDLYKRITQHKSGKTNTKHFSEEIRGVAVIFCEDSFIREWYETALIETIRPIFNKSKAYYKERWEGAIA